MADELLLHHSGGLLEAEAEVTTRLIQCPRQMNLTNYSAKRDNQETFTEESVEKVIGNTEEVPNLNVLQKGFIDGTLTYEMISSVFLQAQEVFYTVNVSSNEQGNALSNWLMSGTFCSRHEANTYIHYLKSGKARVQPAGPARTGINETFK